ncbi:hypothetical protein [Nonomuraea dietziae]|uniref:hypothetical protein n=1 Tax=Nonomuraea dietziae TaxID=65515 RepID=UPI0031DE0E15
MRDGVGLADEVGQLGRLEPVDAQQLGHRQEEREAQAGRGVVVDVGPRDAVGDGEGAAARLLQGHAPLVADERDAAVGPDDDVAGVEVAEDQSARVDGGHGRLHLRAQLERPRGVVGGAAALPAEPVERGALDVLQHQEAMLADGVLGQQGGDRVEAGEPGQRLALALEPGHRVGAVGVEPRVGPGLLDDHPRAGARVAGQVDAAPAGQAQSGLGGVRQAVERDGPPRLQVGCEEGGQPYPCGGGEDRAVPLGHQPAVEVGDGGFEPAVGPRAVALGEGAVADVQRAASDAQGRRGGRGRAGRRAARRGR